MTLAIIGGTGLASLAGLEVRKVHAVQTEFGSPSMPVEQGELYGADVLFLHRHGGSGTPIPPHRINYRANVQALAQLGVSKIVAVNAVGAIDPELRPGCLLFPDQLIDYTWGREHTFDDGSSGSLMHVDFTQPFSHAIRNDLARAAERAAIPSVDRATVAVVQGPRLETAAEIRKFARDGCTLVGMTSMPEAALARESGIDYASVCMVVNSAAGVGGSAAVDHAKIGETLKAQTALVARLLESYLTAC